MIYSCCDQLRRDQIVGTGLNGIDYLEVLDHDAANPVDRQRRLFVHFINDLTGTPLQVANIRIEGGERIREVGIDSVAVGTGSEAKVLTVTVKQAGDFSIYTLRLIADPQQAQPPKDIDPMFAAVDFSFKVECPSEFDCMPRCECLPVLRQNPEIDYLAKDYASFRRLMLDRMAFLMPQWQERHAADLSVALVEVLAYVGDYLSYQQDAVATEAYLGTARRRVSVRRHAKLVDYAMHDGCNARVWIQIQVRQDLALLPAGRLLCTRIAGQPPVLPNDPIVLASAREFFETMEDSALFVAHNELHFYTWSDQRCCLPKGATAATLDGTFPGLKIGDVLIFEEMMGPNTGMSGDADLRRRWPVRLTDVETRGEKSAVLIDRLTSRPITQIRWEYEDALPFPLCISSQADEAHGSQYHDNISVARGNIVLADHGRTITDEDLGTVPQPTVNGIAATACDPCNQVPPSAVPPRYRPLLAQRPLTFALTDTPTPVFGVELAAQDAADLDNQQLPVDLLSGFKSIGVGLQAPLELQGSHPLWSVGDGIRGYLIRLEQSHLNVYAVPAAASAKMWLDPRMALPAIRLASILKQDKLKWTARRDLLESSPTDPDFIVETESDGGAWLRFGDGQQLGGRPDAGTRFSATYRVGNGAAGNVGAESIAHLVSDDVALRQAVIKVCNPLPATGGVEPESLDQVRAYAPVAYRTQERAVTEADYAEVTERHPQVQQARATFRWTGSWHTVFITVDRLGGLPVDEAFKAEIRSFVERFRMAGYDLEVDAPRFVSLEIAMHICVQPDYFREDVKGVLLNIFSDRVLPDGRRGVFHPDNFTFGQTVFLSPLIAAAQAVEGVLSVQTVTFQRQGTPDPQPLAAGKLELGRLEIAHCANDPNFAERGVFKLTLGGGK
ncbi:putative baseplate assembly protein [Burkholderia sp. YR290]|nr:putative baseplate assembly protein [Burkholderia sp. YR290]